MGVPRTVAQDRDSTSRVVLSPDLRLVGGSEPPLGLRHTPSFTPDVDWLLLTAKNLTMDTASLSTRVLEHIADIAAASTEPLKRSSAMGAP